MVCPPSLLLLLLVVVVDVRSSSFSSHGPCCCCCCGEHFSYGAQMKACGLVIGMLQVVNQSMPNTGERQLVPRDLVCANQSNFSCFFSRRDIVRQELGSVPAHTHAHVCVVGGIMMMMMMMMMVIAACFELPAYHI